MIVFENGNGLNCASQEFLAQTLYCSLLLSWRRLTIERKVEGEDERVSLSGAHLDFILPEIGSCYCLLAVVVVNKVLLLSQPLVRQCCS